MNQQGHFQERRRYPRISRNIPVKICSDDFDLVTETKNLSRTGTYCRVNKYIEPMTKLKVQLLLQHKRSARVVTKKISCQGVVVRTESVPGGDYYNVAIYFNEIQNRDADYITDYVNMALNKST